MGRKKQEKRVQAKQLFLDSDGIMSNTEIAEALEVNSAKIRKWKCEDKWKEELEKKPRRRGGQKGNRNAVGHGAPRGNQNAVTHGAYSRKYYENLSEEEREQIDSITLDSMDNMLWELKNLIAKETDLKKRIAEYNTTGQAELYTDKVVEMRTPAKVQEDQADPYGSYTEEDEEQEEKKVKLNVSMETTVKSSAFERAMKLEAELNKVHGRIIKLLDSIKSYELEQRRIEIEEKRYTLLKQKLSGVYDVDPDTGEIDDTYRPDDADIEEELNEEV